MYDSIDTLWPTEFNFTGWHPHCRCYVITKLPSREEMRKWNRMTDEEQAEYHFEGEVSEVPKGYSDWMEKNAGRIEGAKSVPYFIKDNPEYAAQASGVDIEAKIKENSTEQAIRGGMFGRGKNNAQASSIESDLLDIKDIPIMEDKQRENTEAFLKKLGYSDNAIRGTRPMPFDEADQGKANYSGDIDNCQLCAPTLLARMRGINISAPSYSDGGFAQKLSNDMRLAFADSEKLSTLKFTADKKPVSKMIEKLERTFANLPDNSIHHFGYDWCLDGEDGHIWTVIKADNKLFIVDGQEKRGMNNRLGDIIPRIDFKNKVELMRVDNLAFSEDFMNFFS